MCVEVKMSFCEVVFHSGGLLVARFCPCHSSCHSLFQLNCKTVHSLLTPCWHVRLSCSCGVCGSEEAKYRCPACLAHSCRWDCCSSNAVVLPSNKQPQGVLKHSMIKGIKKMKNVSVTYNLVFFITDFVFSCETLDALTCSHWDYSLALSRHCKRKGEKCFDMLIMSLCSS